MVAKDLTDAMTKAGKSLILQMDEDGVEVDAAFWLYFSDIQMWKLLLSMPAASSEGPKKAYRKVQKAIGKLGEDAEELSLAQVAVLKPKAPVLHLLRSAVRVGPDIGGVRFTGNVINGQLIEDAYLYRIP